jgi:hypothetical protein
VGLERDMNFRLTIIAGHDAGRRYELVEREMLLIGRGDDCGVRLSDPSISRVHLRITNSGGHVMLEDAGSRWGTRVNGSPTDNRELASGDCIEIGDTQLRLEADSAYATTLAPVGRKTMGGLAAIAQKARANPSSDWVESAPQERDRRVRKRSNTLPTELQRFVGKKFLRFQVGSIVAEARSGVIFHALDPKHDRPVALKIFRPDFLPDRVSERRFLRAVRATIPWVHKNLVRLHTAGRARGYCFMASEFVDGESVSQMIRRIGVAGMLDWRNAWHVANGVANALEFAHENNVLHRNIGPSNILVRATDRCVKLGDLMLAKALDQTADERITRPGEVIGDLRYLSPEQLSGEQPVDARADIYSLGATLYAILTGRPPFEGGTAAEVIRRVVSGTPEPPTKFHLAIPAQFEGLVLRMLVKTPEDRPENATRLKQDLERVGRCCGVE